MTDHQATFSRAGVLGGMPARRAGTILFAIESRTAHLVDRSRTAMATYLTERAEADRERDFLAALAHGREPIRVSIQDLERHATGWSTLIPPDAETRAAIAWLLADKHRFRASDVPNVRAALGLDDPAVEAAFLRQRDAAVATLYAPRLSVRERLRWWRASNAARLESLPPVWMAFALTLTETVGAGVLALPIALAGLGLPFAVGLLVVFGLVNVLTVVALVEAITRDGTMRFGTSYFGRFVGEFLGPPGSLIVTIAMLLLNAIGLVALMIGFGSALAGASGVPAGVWAALLAVAILAILRRESLDATVASVLVIGAVNITILILVGLVGLTHFDQANLAAPGGAAGPAADASLLGLVFGTALMAYFGHTSAGNAAKVVLRRDPGGRSLLVGNAAAILVAIGLYVLTVVAVLGAVPATELIGYDGTALTPLAAVGGPVIVILGSVFVVLAMGLSSLHIALGLYNQVGEWLPVPSGDPARRRQSFVKAAPVVGLLIVLELLLLAGGGSFTGSLSFLGTVTVPLLGGLFPMLLVLAARRRGEYVPSAVIGWIGHPITAIAISAVFFVGLLAHAVVIWSAPIERIAALIAAAAFVVVAAWAIRAHAFRPRTVVELRVEEGRPDRALLAVVSCGRPVTGPRSVVGATPADRRPRSRAGGRPGSDPARPSGHPRCRPAGLEPPDRPRGRVGGLAGGRPHRARWERVPDDARYDRGRGWRRGSGRDARHPSRRHGGGLDADGIARRSDMTTGRVLIVDDALINRRLLERLVGQQGHAVETAEDGLVALERLGDDGRPPFDVVLLDLLMPGLDGYATLERMKADPALAHLPVIIISAVDELDSVVRCIELGALDYLPKPVDPSILRARLTAALAAKRLRDLELEYLEQVARVTEAAGAVEAGSFDLAALDGVAARTDALGQLARTFRRMAGEVQAREERLRAEVRELRIEIDEARQARQVAEITDTDYFRSLRDRAVELRRTIDG